MMATNSTHTMEFVESLLDKNRQLKAVDVDGYFEEELIFALLSIVEEASADLLLIQKL